MPKSKFNVVIVGGGFAGLKAAIELCEDDRFSVTLIAEHPDMRIYGSLYHTATGGSDRVSSIPLSEVFQDRDITIIQNRATRIDRKAHEVITEDGARYDYNALILALGVKTNYFGIDGLEQYSYGIKSLEEAEELKRKIHENLTSNLIHDYHYVVVGGGPSGIEIAGALPGYIKKISEYHDLPKKKIHVDLIEAAPRLLPRMPKEVSKSVSINLRKQGVKIYLNTSVQGQTADELLVHGKPIRSHTVVWTAGMSNNPFFVDNNFQITQNGKVRVDQFLQAEIGIYVLGDNADTPYSGMAQTALNDGKFVAENLKRLVNDEEPRPYIAKKPIYVLPAGPKWAAVIWGPVQVYGRLGWVIRRLADFVAYKDYTSWPLSFSRFMSEDDKEEFCPICASELAK